jgi:hypothetical protein
MHTTTYLRPVQREQRTKPTLLCPFSQKYVQLVWKSRRLYSCWSLDRRVRPSRWSVRMLLRQHRHIAHPELITIVSLLLEGDEERQGGGQVTTGGKVSWEDRNLATNGDLHFQGPLCTISFSTGSSFTEVMIWSKLFLFVSGERVEYCAWSSDKVPVSSLDIVVLKI